MTFDFYLSSHPTQKNIHLCLTTLTKVYNLKTSLKISLNEWDKDKQQPKNIYIKKFKEINQRLIQIKLNLLEHIEEKENNEDLFNRTSLMERINKICLNKGDVLPENSFLHYIKVYLSSRKDLITHSTYKRYKVFYHLLERLEGYLTRRLYIEHINSDFINNFLQFARLEEYSENTIYRTIHFVKTILNFAERKGIRTGVGQLEIRRGKQHKTVISLSECEIKQIKNTKVPQALENSKQWLIISCYTGQRFSDFIQFKVNKLQEINGKKCIEFTQEKTGKEIILPLHPAVLDVLKENKNVFPEVVELHTYNLEIKKISKLANLNNTIKARKRIGHRSKELALEKWELISSHIGRRSFASNFYGKIPTPLLMDATGHSTELMFLKYVNPSNTERIVSLSNYFDDIYLQTPN